MDSLIKDWALFLDRCLENRIQADLFDAAAAQLHTKSPLPGPKLAALLLKPRSAGTSSLDPRVVIYAERLLALKKVDTADVLSATFQHSKDRSGAGEETNLRDPSRWRNPPELEEIIFYRLQKAYAGPEPERPATNTEAHRTLVVVTRWMSAMVISHTSDSMMQAINGTERRPQDQQQSYNVREALGVFVSGLIDNGRILQLLNKDELKDLRKEFAKALSTFIPFLSQTSIQLANRLEIYQKEHDLHELPVTSANGEGNENARLEVAALQLEAVVDLPTISTRAGIFIFLNSLLVARPLTDDFAINTYLHARYKMDAQAMATDLVTAAFDILANAMYRSETSQTLFSLKSFLVNKVPLLLAQLVAPIYAMNAELCITQALSHVDPNAFPAFSQGFDDIMGNSNSLADVRQDFLNACALHGLIPASTIERLLGEPPLQGPPETKYVKQDLVSQCKDNFEKVNMFIDELENLDGNAGAIVAAITELISHLCEMHETMYLKTICNSLSKKPQALDIILQFTSPANVLRPLCQFLDEWRYDGDQEYQPVYDEFGAILVLVLALVHRFDLTYLDLGIEHESFVAQLLERGHRNIPPDELTDEQGRQLGSWLRGLYDSDKVGLTNDVFASCRPQDFYLLAPTFFSQTVMACSAEVLSLDSVKGGLEYLHETFLLPSLVGGLKWMASHALTQTHQDLDVLMQIFVKLIKSAPTSGDAQAMHATIISVVSARLQKCLLTLKRRHPSRTDIDPLIQAIKGSAHYERSMYPSMGELEKWTNAPHNTLNTALRHTVQQLCQWAATDSLQPNPPNYTHRQLYASLKLLGTSKTLQAIVDEVKAQSHAGNGQAALDIGLSLICAPMIENSAVPVDWVGSSDPAPHPPRTRLNLREMLKFEFDNAASLVAMDPMAAETIVRLHRRVEGHLAVVAQSGLPTGNVDLSDVNIVDVQSQALPADLDKAMNEAAAAAATIAAAGGDTTGMDAQALQQSLDQHLDLTAAGGGLNLEGIGVGAAGAGDLTTNMDSLPDLDLDMGGMGDMSMGLGDGEDDWDLDFSGM
ncbi:Med5-domain-containing protein [Lentithecium fluviatile CBS 122367]|uniref:Mediator of RNA polymerase II transcription subunit 5 n=1 Tax=Lentithecium fluviatile CBS 122367 TaxID=1168545 RepID=A0A6G1JJT2_9PLEO|nr:Med5-domain-containing protein [Lentithecium fluviatile CBS 122367]